MSVSVYTLSNGLRVAFFPGTDNSVYLTLIVRAGVRFEEDEELGFSHPTEHLCMQNFPLHYKMEERWGKLYNAETGPEDITYQWFFLKNKLAQGIRAAFQFLISPVNPKEFASEKKLIGIEFLESLGESDPVLDDLLRRIIWQGHRLEKDNFKLFQKRLQRFSLSQFEVFRRKIHCGRNMALAIVGDVKASDFLPFLEKNFGKLPAGKRLPVKVARLKRRKGFKVVRKPRVLEVVHCKLEFPLPRLSRKEWRVLDLLDAYLANNDLFSRVLFKRLRGAGLLYSISSESEELYDSGSFTIKWVCLPADVKTILRIILEEIGKISQGNLTHEEFRHARRVFYLTQKEKSEDELIISGKLAEQLLRTGRPTNPKLLPKQAQRVKRFEVTNLVKTYLDPNKAVLALYGPVKNLRVRI
ncbi:MAG: pitrilysin family protein [Patescibacteria group bacterium]